MLNTSYNYKPFAVVGSLEDLFKSKLAEIPKVKGILEASKLMLNLPQKKISVMVSQEERVYKYIFLTPGIHDIPMGWFVYLPLERRLDFYLSDSPEIPVIQWKGKKVEFKNYPLIYDKLGFSKLFDRVINII